MKQNDDVNSELRVMEIDWREKEEGGNETVQAKGRRSCNVISS